MKIIITFTILSLSLLNTMPISADIKIINDMPKAFIIDDNPIPIELKEHDNNDGVGFYIPYHQR